MMIMMRIATCQVIVISILRRTRNEIISTDFAMVIHGKYGILYPYVSTSNGLFQQNMCIVIMYTIDLVLYIKLSTYYINYAYHPFATRCL